MLGKNDDAELSRKDDYGVSRKTGETFKTADNMMTYMFSLRYTTSAPFQRMLIAYLSQSVDKQMAEEVFPFDRSL